MWHPESHRATLSIGTSLRRSNHPAHGRGSQSNLSGSIVMPIRQAAMHAHCSCLPRDLGTHPPVVPSHLRPALSIGNVRLVRVSCTTRSDITLGRLTRHMVCPTCARTLHVLDMYAAGSGRGQSESASTFLPWTPLRGAALCLTVFARGS